jgi:hypothetical protein
MEQFNQQFIQTLLDEGLTPSQAAQVAAAEMEGVALNPDGTVHGYQTYCNTLQYPENLQPSEGAREGEEKCTREVAEWLKAHGFNSLNEYYQSLAIEI